jgi:hypothetical protein
VVCRRGGQAPSAGREGVSDRRRPRCVGQGGSSDERPHRQRLQEEIQAAFKGSRRRRCTVRTYASPASYVVLQSLKSPKPET